MFLSLETSKILRVATNSAFPEETSITAFNRDLQKYTDQHGSNEGKTMENHLVLLSMGPTDFLKHIYQIIHLPDINPNIDVETGLQPFLVGWTKVMIYTGTTRDNDEEWE